MIRSHGRMKTMVLAVAFTIPASVSLAAPVSEVVTTRDDQDIHQRYGRDSVYAVQIHQPAQTESRYSSDNSGSREGFVAGVSSLGAAAWDKVSGLFEPGPSAAAQPQPLAFGRAGGYVGTDRLALLHAAGPASGGSEPVTTGESLTANDIRYPAANEEQSYGSVIAQSAPSPEIGTVRDQELNAMTERPADAGAWKQPEVDVEG